MLDVEETMLPSVRSSSRSLHGFPGASSKHVGSFTDRNSTRKDSSTSDKLARTNAGSPSCVPEVPRLHVAAEPVAEAIPGS